MNTGLFMTTTPRYNGYVGVYTSHVSLLHRRSAFRSSLDSSSTLAKWMRDVSVVSVSLRMTRCLSMSLHPGAIELTKAPGKTIQACRRVEVFSRFVTSELSYSNVELAKCKKQSQRFL